MTNRLLSALVVNVILSIDACCCQFQLLQPRDITRNEGVTQVIIPCPDYTGYLPIWSINGSCYDSFSLPNWYQPSVVGLAISVVHREMNNTSFQCFYSTGNGLALEASSVGILTVLRSTNESLQNNGGVEENCNNLYLDHQKMLFGVQFITLAVKGSDTNCNILNVASSLDCRFNISEDTTQSTIDSVITLNESYALTNYSYYFDLSRQNDEGDICQTALGILQIKNSATTETLNIPLYRSEKRTFSLPLSDSPLTLVIPTVGSAILGRDCFCPLIIVDTLQCANLSTCTCFSDTNFTPSMMKICREEQSSTFISIAFQNLTVESNNSRLFFYYSSPPIMECTVLDREYIKSFEILQVLPEIPLVDIQIDAQSICIFSPVEDGIPADEYRISIYDRTGGKIFNTSLDGENCTSVGSSFSQYECAPFTVSVNATNVAGFSVNETILMNDAEGDVCSCINSRVTIDMVVENSDVQSFYIQLNCFKIDYIDQPNIMFEIEVEGGSTLITKTTACNVGNMFDSLSCEESYNISTYWKSSTIGSGTTIQCLLDNDNILMPHCPPGKPNVMVIVPSVVVSCVVVIITIIIAIIIGFYVKKKCQCCVVYNPNGRHSNSQTAVTNDAEECLQSSYKKVNGEDCLN